MSALKMFPLAFIPKVGLLFGEKNGNLSLGASRLGTAASRLLHRPAELAPQERGSYILGSFIIKRIVKYNRFSSEHKT